MAQWQRVALVPNAMRRSLGMLLIIPTLLDPEFNNETVQFWVAANVPLKDYNQILFWPGSGFSASNACLTGILLLFLFCMTTPCAEIHLSEGFRVWKIRLSKWKGS